MDTPGTSLNTDGLSPLTQTKQSDTASQRRVHLSISQPADTFKVTPHPHFSGRNTKDKKNSSSDKKNIVQRVLTAIKSFFTELPKKLFNRMMDRVDKKNLEAVLGNTQFDVKAFLNLETPTRIDYRDFQRPDKGIAKADQVLEKDHPIFKEYAEEQFAGLKEDYGVEWSREKVVRDALQNFYDGQGQNLDSVNIDVDDKSNKATVKLSASATYTPDKLLGLGASGKKGDTETAGGFGEGAKVMSLVMLRDYGVQKVTFRSHEWQAEFTLAELGEEHTLEKGERGLMVKITPNKKPIDGNELSFETTDNDFANLFEPMKNWFYNSANPDFKTPTFDSELGGFKLLEGSSEGHFYDVGQRRYVGSETGPSQLKGMHVWTHHKQLTGDRDRIAVPATQVTDILGEIVAKMNADEVAEGLLMVRDCWFDSQQESTMDKKPSRTHKTLFMFLLDQAGRLKRSNQWTQTHTDSLGIPGNFVAMDNSGVSMLRGKTHFTPEERDQIKDKNIVLIDSSFTKLGVPNFKTIRRSVLSNNTEGLSGTEPSESESKQLEVIDAIFDRLYYSLDGDKFGDEFMDKLGAEFKDKYVVLRGEQAYKEMGAIGYLPSEDRIAVHENLFRYPLISMASKLILLGREEGFMRASLLTDVMHLEGHLKSRGIDKQWEEFQGN